MTEIINSNAWFPHYNHKIEHIYILLTSLNLGGAEKIVADQLWANYYQKNQCKVTLIVIYDKLKEHTIPTNVNIVRLNNDIKNGEIILKQIAFEKKPLVCHLTNDIILNYLFSLNLYINLVIHNDKRGWVNSVDTFSHPQIISIVSVCNYITKQLQELTYKPIYTVRHQISESQYKFKKENRVFYRHQLNLSQDDILIGMTGRICFQKNYCLALDILAHLSRINPNYKLIILGGFERSNTNIYLDLLNKASSLGIRKNLFIVGFKENSFDWINAFDIGLNVSHFEGLSMATQELILNGLPVVLSEVCGQSEILDLNNQLNFFDLPENLNNIETSRLNIDLINEDSKILKQYKELVLKVSTLIEQNIKPRITYDDNQKEDLNNIRYASHNLWSLFHFIPIQKENTKEKIIKSAFLTANLNLGGAQRSLVNLVTELKDDDFHFPVIMCDQSNYTGFYKELIDKKIELYLCNSNGDVFFIMNSLLEYIFNNDINRIVLWNVDSKIKLLLQKLAGHLIDIIDVSPGDYCFVEMDNQSLFQDAIYYHKEQYFSELHTFVSKFDNSNLNQEYKKYLKNPTVVIPNGVVINNQNIKNKKIRNFDISNPFKIIVCGRITPSKHNCIILEAFQKLNQIYPYVIIDFYGSVENYNLDYYNNLLEKYSGLISKEIINFKGNINDPKSIMKLYDTIVVLGTHQGSPNVVLEAVSCKLPCIANDSGGTKEIITDQTGILLPPIPEIDTLLKAMIFSLNNYLEIQQRSENAFTLLQENFSMEKMKNEYLKILF